MDTSHDLYSTSRQERERNALTTIRNESVDPYNRLHSIAEDAEFIKYVRNTYLAFPCLPNLRCGAWYVAPEDTDPTFAAAYFKSTDGHSGSWSFNLRRPNLHVLPLLLEHHGLILVDSTRAGKRIPDALSKTVPIWCCVINRAQQRKFGSSSEIQSQWDSDLYTPPNSVSKQEKLRIEGMLEGWVGSLLNSSYDLPRLDRPLRPIWITPASSSLPPLTASHDFYPIICVSASKLIEQGFERRANGFAYVQGSGDDHESWSCGLTPELFWKHRELLLRAPHSEIDMLIASLVSSKTIHLREKNGAWSKLPTPIDKVSGQICITTIQDLPNPLPLCVKEDQSAGYIILDQVSNHHHSHNSDEPNSTDRSGPPLLQLTTLPGKKGEMNLLHNILPQSLIFMRTHLHAGKSICIACQDGKDISVGVAVAGLQAFFDDNGRMRMDIASESSVNQYKSSVDKSTIRMRLQWIIASRPEANPSRVTMKRVNEFFLSTPYK